MRVLHVSPYYYPSIGGVERFCDELATRTYQLGNEVHVLTHAAKGLKDEEVIRGVKIHRIKPMAHYSKALVTPKIDEKIRDISPDIIHIQGPAPGMVDFIRKNNKTKILMTFHNDLSLDNSLAYKIISSAYRAVAFKRVIQRIDKIVILSEAFRSRSRFSKVFARVPENKISIIPNGVDLEQFSPGNNTKNDYKNYLSVKSRFFATFVGSMEPLHAYKGVEYLLYAISYLRDLDITFSLIGEGQLKQKYMKIAKSLGILDRVSFPGKINDEMLVNYYRASDIFILPSLAIETMPIVMLESMACGTPIITTRTAGPMAMITEGYNGYLVNAADSTGLAKTIKMSISNRTKLREMQINSRIEAEEKYSWKKILGQYIRLYSSMLNDKIVVKNSS
jgi:glycosyltransferase involved in cell wall biosynthesis